MEPPRANVCIQTKAIYANHQRLCVRTPPFGRFLCTHSRMSGKEKERDKYEKKRTIHYCFRAIMKMELRGIEPLSNPLTH